MARTAIAKARTAASARTPISVPVTGDGYPRIAAIFSKDSSTPNQNSGAQDQQRRYHAIVLGSNWLGITPGYQGSGLLSKWFRTVAGPRPKVFLYFNQFFSPGASILGANGVNHSLVPDWYLCSGGSTLTGAITAAATTIPVANTALFYETNGTIIPYAMIGGRGLSVVQGSYGDVVNVTAISNAAGVTAAGNLTVGRNVMSDTTHYPALAWSATTNSAATVVRPIVWEPANGGASTLMDMRSSCAAYTDAAMGYGGTLYNFAQFYAHYLADLFANDASWNGTNGGVDGIFFDNSSDAILLLLSPNAPGVIDVNNTNSRTGMTDAQWQSGFQNFWTQVATATGLPIISNNGGTPDSSMTANTYLNGGMCEALTQAYTCGSPSLGNLAAVRAWLAGWNQKTPHYTIVNASATGITQAAEYTAYQNHRALLALSTCLNDGYFAWDDYSSTDHGNNHSIMPWFEEYDLTPNGSGQRGWMGQPLGPYSEPSANCLIRYFTNGVSVFNGSGSPFAFPLNGTYQRLLGSQAPTINNGALCVGSVTVPANDGLFLIRPGYARVPIGSYQSLIAASKPDHWYKWGDAAGSTTAVDSGSSPNNLGSITGTVTFGAAGLVSGGTAASFTGATMQSVSTEQSPEGFTYEELLKIPAQADGTDCTPFSLYGGIWVANVDAAAGVHKFKFYTFDGTTFQIAGPGGSVFDTNTPHHVVATCGTYNSRITIWIDGVQCGSVAFGAEFPLTGAHNAALAVGRPDASLGFTGTKQHGCIYYRVLPQWEIVQHAAAFLSKTRSVA